MKKQFIDPNKMVSVTKNNRVRVQTMNLEDSKTQQQFKEECDINNIMKKYGNDPVAFAALTRPGGQYADFSEIPDYQGMLSQVADAQDAFMALPATLRARFNNDPGHLINFLKDPNNIQEGISLGILTPKSTYSPSASPNDNSNDDPQQTPSQKPKFKSPTPPSNLDDKA
jgi:phage internal scaffolding protein